MKKASGMTLSLLFLLVSSVVPAEKSAGEHIDDPVITAKVKMALLENSVSDAAAINVETSRGVVQLAGFVESDETIKNAAKIAGNTEGVQSVSNRLRVASGKRSAGRTLDDTILAAKVKLALAESDFGNATKVNVEVRSAIVELSGFVDSYEERDAAASLVSGVDDVKDVINSIDITR